MDEEVRKQSENAAKMFPLLILPMFLLPFVLWFVSSTSDEPWKNSMEAQAFLGARYFYEFCVLVVLQLALSMFLVKRISEPNSKFPEQGRKIIPFALAEFPVFIGFTLGFINENAYLIAPFLALSLVMWVYFYSRREN